MKHGAPGHCSEHERAPTPAVAASPVRVGDVIDNYVIQEVIGEGGMGQVFAAYDAQLARRVAIKVLLPRLFEADDAAATARHRLLREAKAMANIQHANVVTVYCAGTVGGQVYVTMELMPGGTLRRWLDMQPRSWRDIIDVFAEAGQR